MRRFSWLASFTLALALPVVASAQEAEPAPVSEPERPGEAGPATTPPAIGNAGKVNINFVDADLMGLVQYFARATGRNFIIEDTKGLASKKITIIANEPVTPNQAYEYFLATLEQHDLTTVRVGNLHKIIKASDAQQSPGPIREGGAIPSTDNYVTQIIQLENVSVSDVRQIIDNLVSPDAKVMAYAPSNTLILTDTGHNIRRIYQLITQLDVAAPRSRMEIYQVTFADAAEMKSLIETLYGTAETEPEQASRTTSRSRRTRRSSRRDDTPSTPEGVTAGKQARYIDKVISDERTNSLVVIADDSGHAAVADLIARLDVDVDPNSRSQIYTYRLEHAEAQEMASLLSELSQNSGSSSSRRGTQTQTPARRAQGADGGAADAAEGAQRGAAAVFDSGMRIAADEHTNSLVIIADRDDYIVVEKMIRDLDTKRKSVFVEAVVMELSGNDADTFNIAVHAPIPAGNGFGLVGAQLGTSSLSPDVSSLGNGFTSAIYGESITIPIPNPTNPTETIDLAVPTFGIALNAIRTNSLTNIISSPSVTVLDNEEGKIEVGRKIPFPTSNSFNSLGQPITQFQREDVAITLEIKPRINSEDAVTMEVKVTVEEVEEDQSGLDVQQAGFITSKREVETDLLVGDNQTAVIGGLVGSTTSESEAKVPILGDLPVVGALFRNKSKQVRRTNLVIFLTPHIIDSDEDIKEIHMVKEQQQKEFIRRFYGKSMDQQFNELRRLLRYSMNNVDQASAYRGPSAVSSTVTLDGQPVSEASRTELSDLIDGTFLDKPGGDAGEMPEHEPGVEPADVPEVDVIVIPAEVLEPVEEAPAEEAPASEEGEETDVEEGTDAAPEGGQ